MKTKSFKFMAIKAVTVAEILGGEAIIHIDCPITHLNIKEAKHYAEVVLSAIEYAEKRGLK